MSDSFFEKLKECISQKENFSICRLPNSEQIQLWTNENGNQQKFVVQDFEGNERIEICNDNPLEVKSSEFRVQSFGDFQAELVEVSSISNPSHAEPVNVHLNLLKKTIDTIQKTDVKKIVISRKKVVEQSVNPIEYFKRLEESYPNAFVYVLFVNGNCWIGATPETLAIVEANQLKTMSLAGTKTANKKWTAKEYEEQQMVTDYILEKLNPFGKVNHTDVETVNYGNIQHLRTEITCDLNETAKINEVINELHPTPAVCGLPKDLALKFIQKNEGYNRSFYTGFIGIENTKNQTAQFFVNLRCAQIYQNQIHCYIGGGITAESIPEMEWKETELKAESILIKKAI